MKGKIGIVVGLAAGYVLGSRAGRERYEQIKAGYLKLWNTAPVQKQVATVKELGKSAALALPSALWDGAVKVTRAASRSGTPGQKLDSAIRAGRASADDVARGAEKTAAEVKKAADKAVADAKTAAKKAADD
ncbi:hypothetical protein E5344_04500 [Microbacterium laevaniformans]|uniref:YtxH domain-containing protein n=2 Tax=Microbacterium TaxID=33882 RepID=A0A4S2DCY6_9MICO|nr:MULTISPECIES: hypothetical protein [Microbacterium]AXA96498.1 hypothetical protein CEP17_08765 [Microbacterium sp. PM5]KIC57084.1 hypothetical protein RM52_11395 [Microbacterium hominis]TGY38494.1 hypothetical protein E5344_04500 [Microbacterium laevaniformans]